MEEKLEQKYHKLQVILKEMKSVAVAFSGGVDSTLLLKIAHDTLGDNAGGIYCDSILMPARERRSIHDLAAHMGIRLYILKGVDLSHEAFSKHPINRCYLCKGSIFDRVLAKAKELDLSKVVDGSNMDDERDYRPGKKALNERGVRSPMQEAGLTKNEIRELSKVLGLPTHDKDALACLATRIPYGEAVTEQKLDIIDQIEELLVNEGFRNVRARFFSDHIKLEVNSIQVASLGELLEDNHFRATLKEIYDGIYKIDAQGYQTGSMNESI